MKKCLHALLLSGFILSHTVISQAQTAKIQVIHNASDPALDTIDVYANGALVLDNFLFRTATPFIDIPPGITINVGVAPSNSSSVNDTIKNFEFTFSIGQTYCVMAVGVLNPGNFAPNPTGVNTAFNVIVTSGVQLTSLVSGNTELYCSNGVTDAATSDLFNRNIALMADNLTYGSSSGYSSFPSLNYVFDVMDSAQNAIDTTVAADLTIFVDSALAVFTSGFLDPAANQNGPSFGVFAALPNGQVIEFPSVQIAYLQAIHNCSDPAADSVDIWALGFKAVDNFMYHTATNFLAVPAGIPLDVGVALGNSQVIGDTIKNFPVVLENGKNYIALASGVLTPANFSVNPDGNSTAFNLIIADYGRVLSNDPAKVDFITVHGTTDAGTIDVVKNGGNVVVNNLSFSDISQYVSRLPAVYYYDITDSNNTTTYGTFELNLSAYSGKGMVIFTSGFLDPGANQNGPSFGLYGALPDGSVVPFPNVTGINHTRFSNELFTMGPNPATNYLTIRFGKPLENNSNISLINLLGETVYSENINKGQIISTLNTRGLSNGLFFLKFTDGIKNNTVKFINN